jgi:creatinine amidohydrolase/Fe(II)-dependent formamide hydrolase-like protein
VPAAAFEATLEATARSLQRAGLTDVVLLGDHGGYRRSLDRVAARVPHVHALPEYYRASSTDMAQALKAQGFTATEIGLHAGLADTALTLALDPSSVRLDATQARSPAARDDGVTGDPRRATAALGRPAADHVVEVSVAAIRAAVGKPQSAPRP